MDARVKTKPNGDLRRRPKPLSPTLSRGLLGSHPIPGQGEDKKRVLLENRLGLGNVEEVEQLWMSAGGVSLMPNERGGV